MCTVYEMNMSRVCQLIVYFILNRCKVRVCFICLWYENIKDMSLHKKFALLKIIIFQICPCLAIFLSYLNLYGTGLVSLIWNRHLLSKNSLKWNDLINCTVCPGSSYPFYIVTYDIKWVITSWTDGKYNTFNTCSSSANFFLSRKNSWWSTISLSTSLKGHFMFFKTLFGRTR